MDENFLVDLARDTFLIFFISFVKKLKLKRGRPLKNNSKLLNNSGRKLVSNVQRSRRHRRKTNDDVETKFFVEKETQMWSDAAKKKKSGQKFPPRLVGLRAASAEQESMMAGSHHFSWESGWKEGCLATTEFD